MIRADAASPLVVDGGPGTGKTVVALHRAAYLLSVDPRIGRAAARAEQTGRGGGVLVVAPSDAYVSYADDVLPSLGEEGVRTCTLRDLVPEGAGSLPDDDEAAAVKGTLVMVEAVEALVSAYEPARTTPVRLDMPWGTVMLGHEDWCAAARSVEPGTVHNEARAQVWDSIGQIVLARLDRRALDDDALDADGRLTARFVRRVGDWLGAEEALVAAFDRAWPLIDPASLVATLLGSDALLARHAPSLTAAQRARIARRADAAWTGADLPLIDAARNRVGDPRAEAIVRARTRAASAQNEIRRQVADELIAGDDDDLGLLRMLNTADVGNSLFDDAELPEIATDALAGPFAHIVVDEAQELSDAAWQMIIARCPSRSVTLVGDRAQARTPFAESWAQRLDRVGLRRAGVATLSVNYRTPRSVMAVAEPVIRRVVPDANVPLSVRDEPDAVVAVSPQQARGMVQAWLAEHSGGVVAVFEPDTAAAGAWAALASDPRLTLRSPVQAKGLEFDVVVLADQAPPAGDGHADVVDRYVAMTRATSRLILMAADRVSAGDERIDRSTEPGGRRHVSDRPHRDQRRNERADRARP